MKKPFILCILDGWGHGDKSPSNAISQAKTPCWDALNLRFQKSLLGASGQDVGLPQGQMGNSEVGHMTIGAGRIILQDLPRIDQAISTGELGQNKTLQDFAQSLKYSGKPCHLMGLLSPGGVHSHIDHVMALAQIMERAGVTTFIHGFLDGRDTPPKSAKGYIQKFLNDIENLSHISLASLGGRYYGMDRDNRWERIDQAFEAIVKAKVPPFDNPLAYIQQSYDQGVSDEFVVPGVKKGYPGFQKNDGLLVANFRADRVRQILTRFTETFKDAQLLGMASYSTELSQHMKVLFTPQSHDMTLGDVIAQKGLTQLRLAETEKYAHVTYFLNGGREEAFKNEKRIMVPSPKVATYDLQPEMSSSEVTDKVCEAIESQDYDLIVVNYANADMVGHTGDLSASILAVEALDRCLKRIWTCVESQKGTVAITADHGNVEAMVDPSSGETHTAHTLNPVPFLLCTEKVYALKPKGILADIAPTILEMMNLEKPAQMTGHTLLIP